MAANPLQNYLQVQQRVDRNLDKLLRDAAADASRQIRETFSRPGFSSAVRRAQLQMIQRELYAVLDEMWEGVDEEIRRGYVSASEAAVDAEASLVETYLESVGEPMQGFRAAAERVRAQTVDLVLARGANNIPLSAQVYRSNALSKGFVDRLINNGLLTGMNSRRMAQEVKAFIRPDVRGGVSYAAQRLSRTEINNAFHRTQVDVADAEPWVTGMRWHLSGSHPTPDECNQYAEESHYRGGDPGVYKKGSVPKKPHPQCLCYVTSVVVSEGEFITNFSRGRYNGFLR